MSISETEPVPVCDRFRAFRDCNPARAGCEELRLPALICLCLATRARLGVGGRETVHLDGAGAGLMYVDGGCCSADGGARVGRGSVHLPIFPRASNKETPRWRNRAAAPFRAHACACYLGGDSWSCMRMSSLCEDAAKVGTSMVTCAGPEERSENAVFPSKIEEPLSVTWHALRVHDPVVASDRSCGPEREGCAEKRRERRDQTITLVALLVELPGRRPRRCWNSQMR